MLKPIHMIIGAVVTTLALAATPAVVNAAVAASDADIQLDEVIVTATKREESLQRVPVSVNVLSGEQLQQDAVVRLQDIQLPSLTVQEGGIGNNVYIRGIGSGINPGFEQSSGTYIDGVYHGRGQQSRAPLLDVARLELLRGPQTTLFGKNSVAGAINITSAQPTRELAGFMVGTHDTELRDTQFEGAISGPITERLRGRLSARSLSANGYVMNLTTGEREVSRDDLAARVQLAFDITPDLVATLKAETQRFDKKGRTVENYNERAATAAPFAGLTYARILSTLTGSTALLNNTVDYQRSGNLDTSNNQSHDYALSVDWSLGERKFTAISGYSSYSFDEFCDCDFTGANIFNVPLRESFRQFSQEFRLASPQGRFLDYIVGAYYDDTRLSYQDSIQINSTSLLIPLINARQAGAGSAIANTGTPRQYQQTGSSASAFVSLTWNFANRLHLNTGARLAHDKKDASRTLAITSITGAPLAGAAAVVAPLVYASVFNVRAHSLAGSRSSTKFMPSASLQFDIRDGVMGYVAVSKGNKSGGFDARSNNPSAPPAVVCTSTGVPAGCIPASGVGSFEFDDEDSNSYELGLKSRFADGRAELNVDYYLTDFKKLQVSTFDGVLGFNVSNAGAARIQGFELDGRWQLSRDFRVRSSLAWTDFKYKDFFGQCYVGQVANAPDGRNCNYAGKTSSFVSDLSGNLALDYSAPLGARLRLGGMLEAVYSSKYFPQATLDPATVQSAFTKFNARIAISGASGKWDIALLGRNITDKTTVSYTVDMPLAARTFGAPSYGGFVAEPRSISLQGRISF